MTRKLTATVSVTAIAAALALSPAAAQAGLGIAAAGPQQMSDPAKVAAYWTDQRMGKAKPADVVIGGLPEEAAAGPGDSRAGLLVPFTSFELPNTTSFPERIHGKVFFTKPGGGNFVCSGTVVNGANDSTIVTAGHCVFGAGGWATNFAFAPGYRKLNGTGDAPFGVWPASNLYTTNEWMLTAALPTANYRFDVATAVITKNSFGQELEDAMGGARGIVFNQSTSSQQFRSHGYPAVAPFDGYKLWACDSAFGFPDTPIGIGPPTMAIGCDMTGGASGGGWVLAAGSNAGSVNSVNSYKYGLEPDLMFGPYFGSETQALFNQAQGQAPGTALGGSGSGIAPITSTGRAQPASKSLKRKCKKSKRKGQKSKGKKKRCKKNRKRKRK